MTLPYRIIERFDTTTVTGAIGCALLMVGTGGAVAAPPNTSDPPAAAQAGLASSEAPNRLGDEANGPTERNQAASQPTLTFNFRHAPWDDVLEWFAEQADLSFALDVTPTGTFNYVDDRSFTPAQALDVLNGVLLTKGYTLVRRGKMLLIIDLEDEIDAELVRDLLVEIPVDKLDTRGEYEIAKCRFTLSQVPAEEAEKQIKPLLSPVGSVVVMPQARQLLVTETGGKLRTIRGILKSLESSAKPLHAFRLKHATADEVLAVARPLLNIPEDGNAAEDASVRVSADPLGSTVFVTGSPDKVALVEQIVEQVDGEAQAASESGTVAEKPQFMAHDVTTADPDAVLRVLQTIFVGDPNVRLEIDQSTGGIIALALPSQHRTIQATIAEMQQRPERFEVIPLRVTDPAMCVLLIEKMFSQTEGEGTPNAPIVDGTLQPRQLVVRGTQAQIEQIRSLLRDMGEDLSGGSNGRSRPGGRFRVVPMDPATAESVLERVERIWPMMRGNQIRVMTPSRSEAIRRVPTSEDRPARRRPPSSVSPGGLDRAPADRSRRPATRPPELPPDRTASRFRTGNVERERASWTTVAGSRGVRVVLVSQHPSPDADGQPSEAPESVDINKRSTREQAVDNAPSPSDKRVDSAPSNDSNATRQTRTGKLDHPDIIVAPGPGGVTIASEDEDALDAFESLLETLSGQSSADRPRLNVFYLKHVAAETARELVDNILSGMAASTPSVGSGGQSSRGKDDSPRGVIGSLLQGGDGAGSSIIGEASALIVADNRLNSLYVQGTPAQVDLIGQLLKVIDQESGPEEVLTFPKPKFIPVYYTSAESVAEVLRQVYANRIETEASNSRRPTSPLDMMRAMRGGGGDRSSRDRGRGSSQTDQPKMSLGVDVGSNSLIVSAPGPLLKEVEAVIEEIDRRANLEAGEDVVVRTLKSTNPSALQQSLSSLFGEMVQTSGTTGGSSRGRTGGPSRGPGGPGGGSTGPSPDDIRRRMEFINRMRGAFGGGGPGGFRGGGRPSGGGDGRSRGGRTSGRGR